MVRAAESGSHSPRKTMAEVTPQPCEQTVILLGNLRAGGALATPPPTLGDTRTLEVRMPTALDITGQRFGRLVALRKEPSPLRNTRWRCKCDCGAETIVILAKLRSGHTRSCGCLQKETRATACRTHGQSKAGQHRKASRLYDIWCNMKARCNRPTSTHYRHYGARGIKVCSEWNDFQAFEKWALEHGYLPDLTIDRIDNDGGYEPENCQWATRAQQTRNSRQARLVEYDGKVACIKDHTTAAGVSYSGVRWHMRRGRPIEDAIERVRKNERRWR